MKTVFCIGQSGWFKRFAYWKKKLNKFLISHKLYRCIQIIQIPILGNNIYVYSSGLFEYLYHTRTLILVWLSTIIGRCRPHWYLSKHSFTFSKLKTTQVTKRISLSFAYCLNLGVSVILPSHESISKTAFLLWICSSVSELMFLFRSD